MAFIINFSLNKYKWTEHKKVYVAGYIWRDKKYIEGEDFACFVHQISTSVNTFRNELNELNGQFSVVVEKENQVWLVSSHTWSFPVFYSTIKNEMLVSDMPERVVSLFDSVGLNQLSCEYFLQFGSTPQNHTLLEKLFQVKPNELLVLEGRNVNSYTLTSNLGKNHQKLSEEILQKRIISIFEKYADYLKDKQVLLPLTAGYDSRLLACLFKQFGHKNVLCATWGRKDNPEVNVAGKVAAKLGYKHVFVEYNSELIQDFTKRKSFAAYINHAGHFSSMPFLQDYFAVKYLIDNDYISEKTVVLPGHSGDFFAGSHLEQEMELANTNYLLSRIIEKYGSSLALNPNSKTKLETEIRKNFFKKDGEAWRNFEAWDFQDRQSKFISNSNQVYSFFGLQAIMPLFDKDFIAAFANIPFQQKLNAGLYNSTLEKFFFTPVELDFDLKFKIQHKEKFRAFKRTLKRLAPYFLKQLYYPTKDTIFYQEITAQLVRELSPTQYKKPQMPHKYNAYIIQWYLQNLKQKLNPLINGKDV